MPDTANSLPEWAIGKVYIERVGGCWNWQRGLSKGGYARVWKEGKSRFAHRLMLERKMGRPIRPKLCACHTCDNRKCLNPDHLWEGTYAQNMADCVKKGRTSRGEQHHNRVMDRKKVRLLREDFDCGGYTLDDLAIKYGIARSTVRQIVTLRTWRNPCQI